MTERLVVVGGDAAGMSAASQARRRRPPEQLEIIAFERGRYTSYSACGIPYYIGGVVDDVARLITRSPEAHRARDIDVRLEHEVIGIDLDARTVRVRHEETEHDEPFDHLMIGTGATPVRPPLEGIDADGIFGVQTLTDGIAVRSYVDEQHVARAVVVGGGYIGLEMAEAFAARGIDTSVIEMASQPMSTLDPDMGEHVARAIRNAGITLHVGEAVNGFETRNGRVTSVVTAARELQADVVVLGLGVKPNVKLAEAAGLTIGETGGIVVDDRMRTSAEGVWAGGDCVETYHRISRSPVAIALGTHANKQGRTAGTNITGGAARFGGVLGTAITKVCDAEIGRTGLGLEDALAGGSEAVSAAVRSRTRAAYYPGSARTHLKVIADRREGRLLGAQIVGGEGSAKRIDVFAVALWNGMTVHELAGADLSYAPPFSPVWDPVLYAARTLSEQLS